MFEKLLVKVDKYEKIIIVDSDEELIEKLNYLSDELIKMNYNIEKIQIYWKKYLNFEWEVKKRNLIQISVDDQIFDEYIKIHKIKIIKKLGSGAAGSAYEIQNNKVLKMTVSESEYKFAKKLIGMEGPIAKIYSVDIVEKKGFIIQEKLIVKEYFYELFEKYHKQIAHNRNFPEFKLSKDCKIFKQEYSNIQKWFKDNFNINNIGRELDVHSGNFGYDLNGKLKVFDLTPC